MLTPEKHEEHALMLQTLGPQFVQEVEYSLDLSRQLFKHTVRWRPIRDLYKKAAHLWAKAMGKTKNLSKVVAQKKIAVACRAPPVRRP